MSSPFDISPDEMPLFLSEVDEHLQTLDGVLVQIEQLDHEDAALQSAFRAAHTLKGMAGVIGHHRMVSLTHALETLLDGVRKGRCSVTSELIDLCLDAVDGLRVMREEVVQGVESQIDVEDLVARFALPVISEVVALQQVAPFHPEPGAAQQLPQDVLAPETGQPGFQQPAPLPPAAEILPVEEMPSTAEMPPTAAQPDPVDPPSGPAAPAAPSFARSGAAVSTPKNGARHSGMMVRTSVERLDALMGLVGELITDRNHLSAIRGRLDQRISGDDHFDQLTETVAHLSRITDQLQEEVMRIRMLPVGNVFLKFPRLVRDLAQKTGKKVDLEIRGEDTELDRSVLDEINDPLIHLLRNAVDHGIEPPAERIAAGKPESGRILLTARHEQGRIMLTVEDDGRGIDGEQLRRSAVARGLLSEEEARGLADDKTIELIFLSGFSTAAAVSDISGRGVGMDIVRSNIQRINGNILIDTRPGCGTQFQIILPLTLAIIPTLLVRVGAIAFAIPIVMVAETLRLTADDIRTVRGRPVTLLRSKVLPLVNVRDVFNLPHGAARQVYSYAVVVYFGKQLVGLVVDALLGEEEVVVKSLGALIGDVPGISSATILGDGSVALIMDVNGLLKTYGAQ